MLPPEHYAARRAELISRLESPVLLFAGGEVPRNFPANTHPYRADSNFLFLFGDAEPGSAAFLDPGDGTTTLFLPERSVESSLWNGSVPSFDDVRAATGVDRVVAVEGIAGEIGTRAGGRSIASVAVADPVARKTARAITGLDLRFDDPAKLGPEPLLDALADLRLRKNAAEVDELRAAAGATGRAFEAAMTETRPGVPESDLAAGVTAAMLRAGAVPAFRPVLTVRGETLHSHEHGGVLREGDLVLLDAGAEVPSGYGCDVTRTWPANGEMTAEQRDVYDVVLAAERAAIDAVRPGARFLDVHLRACEVVAGGLADLGLLRGAASDLVERGAHAPFFPHGVGHFLGLDAHDLESFGDRILYGEGRRRSEAFGTCWLRIDRDLEPGMVVTIEPGIYFVPAILRHEAFRRELAEVVDFDRAERFLDANDGRGFGGVRIEDDVLVGDPGPDVLTGAIPVEREDLEAIVGSATGVG